MKSLISDKPLVPILDLGMHPFADTFVPENLLGASEPVYPLQVGLNSTDGIIQLMRPTPADDRYNLYEYSYTSANSKFSRNHWESFALSMISKTQMNNHSRVLEIGSNDGYLCSQFKQAGIPNVLGIDASTAMVARADKLGVTTIEGVFGESPISHSAQYDLIVANNVFNHSNKPYKFAREVEKVLSPTGTFVFELPYWMDSVQSGHIDQVYHEHVTYFTVYFVTKLLALTNLTLYDFEIVNYHGGSLRCYVGLNPERIEHDKIENQIDIEINMGLFDPDMYTNLRTEMNLKRNTLIQTLTTKKLRGEHIVGVGAAAKGNTFLNWHNLDHKTIDFITDGSPDKIGKYTPLSRIPIVPDDRLIGMEKTNILFLAWNLEHILFPKLLELNPTLQVVK